MYLPQIYIKRHEIFNLTHVFQIHPDQVVMSHSPLKMFPQFHDKHVLVSGQGPIKVMAKDDAQETTG